MRNTATTQSPSSLKKLQNLLKIGPSYGPNLFNSFPIEALAILCVVLPVLFVTLVAVLHTATLLVCLVGPLLPKVLVPFVALFFVTAVPILKNPVHSLLCLLAVFAAMALTFLSVGAEYLALVFLIVYIGGLAILFLFVVMLLNPNDITKSHQTFTDAELRNYLLALAIGGYTFSQVYAFVSNGLEEHFVNPMNVPTQQELFAALVRTDILSLNELYNEQ